jgi:putative tricarboxylic transport membrane protein
MRAKIRQDLTVGLIVYTLLLVFLIQSNNMPKCSAFFPRMVLGVFGFLNTVMIIQAFGKKEGVNIADIKSFGKPLIFFVGIVLYALLFKLIGYFLSTFILIFVSMFLLNVRPLWKILTITVGYLLFIYMLFVVWLKVPMV